MTRSPGLPARTVLDDGMAPPGPYPPWNARCGRYRTVAVRRRNFILGLILLIPVAWLLTPVAVAAFLNAV